MKPSKLIHLLLALLIICAWAGTAQVKEPLAAEDLPNDLANLIQKDEPGSQVISSIRGDFNGDGLYDYALILKEPKGWRVKAYHAQKNEPYISFDLEDFGAGPDSTTSFKPEQFKLDLVKKGEILNINGRLIPRASHAFDAIKLTQIDDPGTAAFYDWAAVPDAKFESVRKNGSYSISGFGGLGNE